MVAPRTYPDATMSSPRFTAALLAAAAIVVALPAHGAYRITADRGGQIGLYQNIFAQLRASGERVIIDGSCLSACTMFLGLLPPSQVCATPRARLGFHAAWYPDDRGHPVINAGGTRLLWSTYPANVKRALTARGGLGAKVITLQGADLDGLVAPCRGLDRPPHPNGKPAHGRMALLPAAR